MITISLTAADTKPLVCKHTLDGVAVDITLYSFLLVMRYDSGGYLEKTPVKTDPVNGTFQFEWGVRDLIPGLHSVEIRITDPGGMVETTQKLLFNVFSRV